MHGAKLPSIMTGDNCRVFGEETASRLSVSHVIELRYDPRCRPCERVWSLLIGWMESV
jgi:hypothetical protein